MESDDLLAAAFPDAAACLENIPGDRELPDHPLVNQVIHDCLHEAMDLAHGAAFYAAAAVRHANLDDMQEADAVDIAGECAERAGEQQVAAGLEHEATVGDFPNFEKRVA